MSFTLNTIVTGDCLDVMADMGDGSVDAVITDPPYGVQVDEWDASIPPQSILDECLRVSAGPVVWFGAAPIRSIAPTMRYDPLPDRMLVWSIPFSLAKTGANGMYFRWHPIYCWRLPKKQDDKVFWKDVIECNLPGKRDWWFHPGTKPVELMYQIVRAWGGGLVFDPFVGSGTTAVAAIMNGKNFYGCDINPDYVEIANRRIAEAIPVTLI